MTARLAHIVRHPIKSIGYETLQHASLSQGRVLPFDRIWAISHEAAAFDGPLTEWAHKRNFVRGVAAPGLMAVRAETRDDGTLSLTQPDIGTLRVNPDLPADQARLIDWLRPLWPDNRPAPRALERVAGVALTDMSQPYISILSHSSLAMLSEAAGQTLSPHRFRGNLWVDGWAPAAERELIGKRLRIGQAELEIAMPITRCRATCANPETGAEDVETLRLLETLWGNTHFGVYATVLTGGAIAPGDRVEIL
jgi:uncharacterized protein YcbX